MKVCPRCRSLFGEGGRVCPICELKLEPFIGKLGDVIELKEQKGLKATIPEGVVKYLDLKSDDKLEWKMDAENGVYFCKVTRKVADDRRTD